MTRWTYPNIRWWSWCWYDKLLQQFKCFVNCRTRNTWDADCWSKDAFLPSASATAGGCCSCCNRLPSNDKRVYSRRYRVLLGAITGPRWPPPSPPPPPTPTLYSSLKSDCQKTSRVNGHLQTDTPSHAEAKRPRWIMNGHWHARQRHSSENLPSPPPPPLPPPLPPLLLLIKPNSYHPATISTITITTDKTTQQSLPNHRHHLNAAIINTNAATAVNASTITTTTTTTTSTLLLPLLQPPPLLPQPLPLPCLLPPP